MPHHHFGDLTLDFEIVPSVIPSLIHGHTIRSYDVRFEYENDDEALFILKMEISRCQHTTQVWIDRTIVDCPGLPFETTLIHALAKTGQDSFQTQTFGGTILGTDQIGSALRIEYLRLSNINKKSCKQKVNNSHQF